MPINAENYPGDNWEVSWVEIKKELHKLENLDQFRRNKVFTRRLQVTSLKLKFWWGELRKAGVPEEWYTETMIGNPKIRQRTPAGNAITAQSCRCAYFLHRILQEEPEFINTPINILEVGTSFGYLAGLLCKYANVERYYLVDNTSVQELAKYYMTEVGFIDKCRFEKPTESIDLIISTFSLSEMSYNNLDNYIKLFEYTLKPKTGLLYLYQHKNNIISRPCPRIGMVNYPFTEDKWDLDIHDSVKPLIAECYGRLKA